MFVKKNTNPYVTVTEGVERKTLAVGEKGIIAEFVLQQGALLPEHSHLHEHIGYLLSGEILLTVDGQEQLVRPGDSWAIPGHLTHSVKVLETAVVVEAFIPIREDFLR